MRTTVLLGSIVSGLVLGLGSGLALFALLVLGWGVLPGPWARVAERFRVPALLICLVVLPLVGGILSYLEGRLKLR
jgi:hypothetical protein